MGFGDGIRLHFYLPVRWLNLPIDVLSETARPHMRTISSVRFTQTDIVVVEKAGMPISQIMTENVYTVSGYDDIAVAARIMRNHKIHHLMVTDDKELIGIISSFDLLQIIEGRRFQMKNQSTPTSKKKGKRAKSGRA